MRKEILLEGKHAVVTGGGTGIGFGIAAELIDAGAEVLPVSYTHLECCTVLMSSPAFFP